MEYILIIGFVLAIGLLSNIVIVKQLKHRYFIPIAVVVFPTLFFLVILPQFTVIKLAVFIALVASSIGGYIYQKKALRLK